MSSIDSLLGLKLGFQFGFSLTILYKILSFFSPQHKLGILRQDTWWCARNFDSEGKLEIIFFLELLRNGYMNAISKTSVFY